MTLLLKYLFWFKIHSSPLFYHKTNVELSIQQRDWSEKNELHLPLIKLRLSDHFLCELMLFFSKDFIEYKMDVKRMKSLNWFNQFIYKTIDSVIRVTFINRFLLSLLTINSFNLSLLLLYYYFTFTLLSIKTVFHFRRQYIIKNKWKEIFFALI